MTGSTRTRVAQPLKIRQSTGIQKLYQRERTVVGGPVATADTLGNHWAIQAQDEVDLITITGGPTGGTYTLTFEGQTTGAIAYNAPAHTVQDALEGLDAIGPGNVAVTGDAGGVYIVSFQGALGAQPLPNLTATPSLTGGSSPGVAITTPQQGSRNDRSVNLSTGRFDDPMPTSSPLAEAPTSARVEGGHQFYIVGTVTPPPDDRTLLIAQRLARGGKTFSSRIPWPTT
jgi:hypothetical protein